MLITNVTVFGASGSIGPYIIRALLASGFKVTVVTRPVSQADYSSNVIVRRIELTSESLQSVLAGQDAVVSCIARSESATELRIIDAAIAVGVKRFIPSEFGADLGNDVPPQYKALMKGKEGVLSYLKERSAANKDFTWTAIVPGPFFDYFLYAIPFISFDIPNRKANIFDSGNAPWTGTTLDSVGKTVANVLQKLPETANRVVKTLSLQTTQNEILAELKKAMQSEWEVQRLHSQDFARQGVEHFHAERYAEAYGLIFASLIWGDEKERGITVTEEDSDNVLLDIRMERLEDIVARVLKEEH